MTLCVNGVSEKSSSDQVSSQKMNILNGKSTGLPQAAQ